MDTKQFLSILLPPDDNYILTILGEHARYNEAHTSLDSCVAAIAKYDKGPNDVYFAVAKHNKGNMRKKESASCLQCLPLDLDVGPDKPYKSQREAAETLYTALAALKFPEPMLVSSGNGLHCYFPFTQPVSVSDWVRLAHALDRALTSQGVPIDRSKFDDASMVLRPIGTHNKKDPQHWRPVRLLAPTVPREPREWVALLKPFDNGAEAPAGAPGKVHSPVLDAVLGDISTVPFESTLPCPQIAALVATGGELASEHLWRASLGVAKYCDDPPAAILAMAGKYPGFDMDENLKKMSRWQGNGPTTCAYFENANPNGCAKCPFKGRLTTPTALAYRDVDALLDTEVQSIKWPRGYSTDGRRIVYKPIGEEESVVVSETLLYPIAQFTTKDYAGTRIKLRIRYTHGGWREVEMEHSVLAGEGKEFTDFLYAKRIWCSLSQAKYLRRYLVTYLRELTEACATTYLYEHYGWQDNESFLLGNMMYSPAGEHHVEHIRLAGQLNNALSGKGTIDHWVSATALFDQPELVHHGFALLVGLAGPLWPACGLEGLLVNMYSPDSGSGKSITGMFALSAWGNPETLFMTVRDTENAIYKKLGTLKNTGAYIDEITMIVLDLLRGMVSAISQGREKERITSTAKEFNKAMTWSMPVLSSSNQDLISLLSIRLTNEGEINRILQLPFNRVGVFEEGGKNLGYRVMRVLKDNHGLAGPLLVKEILRRGGMDWVKKEYHNTIDRMESLYGLQFRGPDRYIQAGFVLADIVGRLLTELHLIKFDYKAAIQRTADYLHTFRHAQQSQVTEGPEIINQYLHEHADQIVHYFEYRDGRTALVKQPPPREATARMEIAVAKGDVFFGGNLYINRSDIRKWCRQSGLEYNALLNQLDKHKVIYEDGRRYTIYKGVNGMGGIGQTKCLYIKMNSHTLFLESGRSAIGHMDGKAVEDSLQEVNSTLGDTKCVPSTTLSALA